MHTVKRNNMRGFSGGGNAAANGKGASDRASSKRPSPANKKAGERIAGL